MFKKGFTKKTTRTLTWLSLPLIKWGKKLSDVPVLKWLINPFFAYPHNEVTAIPIHVDLEHPKSVPVPRRVLERLLEAIDDKFLLDECHCRTLYHCETYSPHIGCMALGPATRRMHPTQGHFVNNDEAKEHVKKAADAGLVANVAHVWIDPIGFAIVPFKHLLFICFCDECCCIYRNHMKSRGPNLNRAYQKLPGVSVVVDHEKCTGCGECVDRCFVDEIIVRDGKALIGKDCKGCGRCVEVCPENAVRLEIEDEEKLFQSLVKRFSEVSKDVINT